MSHGVGLKLWWFTRVLHLSDPRFFFSAEILLTLVKPPNLNLSDPLVHGACRPFKNQDTQKAAAPWTSQAAPWPLAPPHPGPGCSLSGWASDRHRSVQKAKGSSSYTLLEETRLPESCIHHSVTYAGPLVVHWLWRGRRRWVWNRILMNVSLSIDSRHYRSHLKNAVHRSSSFTHSFTIASAGPQRQQRLLIRTFLDGVPTRYRFCLFGFAVLYLTVVLLLVYFFFLLWNVRREVKVCWEKLILTNTAERSEWNSMVRII